MDTKLSNKIFYLGIIILSVIVFLLYLKSFHVGFISDDFDLIFDYKVFLNPSYDIRWSPIKGGVFWLINVFGRNPLLIRILFFAFFLTNIFLVYKIIYLLSKNRLLSFLSIFIYTIFYRNPQIIYWISGSLEIILATFFLFSILSFILYRQNKKRVYIYLTLLFFILAILTKESAIVLPLVLLLIDFFVFQNFKFEKLKSSLIPYLYFICLAGIYIFFLIFTSSRGHFLARGDYHAANLHFALTNYANILINFLPLKLNQSIVEKVNIAYYIIASCFALFIVFVLFKKIFKEISLFLGIMLILAIPYAVFGNFGFQERYLFLALFGFSGFIGSLVWFLANKFNAKFQILFIISFCLIWGYFSVDLIFWRSRDWLLADQAIKKIQNVIAPNCPSLNSSSMSYLINFPRFINDQVFVLNNGLGNMLNLTCKKENVGGLKIIEDSGVSSFLKNSQNSHQPLLNSFVFAYEDGEVKDYSQKYTNLEKFIQEH